MTKLPNAWYIRVGLTAVIVGLAGCSSSSEGDSGSSSSKSKSPSHSASPSEEQEDRLSFRYFEENEPLLFHAGEDHARFVTGWDYESCADVESEPDSLVDTECEYAIELQYEVKDERTRFALLLLKVPDGLSVTDHSQLGANASFEDVEFHDGGVLEEAVGEADDMDGTAGDFILMARGSTTSQEAAISDYVEQARSTVSQWVTELGDEE